MIASVMTPVVFFMALLIPPASGSCNLGWLEYEGSCYSFNKEKVSWFDAAAACLVYESHLVQVDSAAENAWLAIQLNTADIVYAWLGGTSRLHSSIWEWVPSFRRIGDGEEESGLDCDDGDEISTTRDWLEDFNEFRGEENRYPLLRLRRQADSQKKRDNVEIDRNTVREGLTGSRPPTTFVNWRTGEPNNQGVRFDQQENCLEITSSQQYKWNNVNCLQTKSFICEKDA
ncbi:hypothetical protein BsWGS_23761 [Bradybaena similaris]